MHRVDLAIGSAIGSAIEDVERVAHFEDVERAANFKDDKRVA